MRMLGEKRAVESQLMSSEKETWMPSMVNWDQAAPRTNPNYQSLGLVKVQVNLESVN